MTTMSTGTSASGLTAAESRLRILGAGMVVALLAQFVLGMANTFWLEVPESGSGWKSAAPAGLLMVHVTLALALVVLALWIGIIAVRTRNRGWMLASVVGIIGLLLAAGGGTAFMGETSDDSASFVMALGCAVAIGSYALALYRIPVVRAPREDVAA